MRYRQGMSRREHIYAQHGDEPTKQDPYVGRMEDPELAKRVCRLLNADEVAFRQGWPNSVERKVPHGTKEMREWMASNTEALRKWGEKYIDPGDAGRCAWRDKAASCLETPVGVWRLVDPPPHFSENIGPKERWYCLAHGELFEKVGWHRLFGEASKPDRADFQHKVSIHVPPRNGRSVYARMFEDLEEAIKAREAKILYGAPKGAEHPDIEDVKVTTCEWSLGCHRQAVGRWFWTDSAWRREESAFCNQHGRDFERYHGWKRVEMLDDLGHGLTRHVDDTSDVDHATPDRPPLPKRHRHHG